MSELRYNLISRDWVILATERAKRPHDFIKAKKEKPVLPEYKKDCPFCPGNEIQTPEEIFRIKDNGSWRVRVVYNKFGALSPIDNKERQYSGLYRAINGFGEHEVIIEHPRHNNFIGLMKNEEVEDIIRAYKARYLDIQGKKGIEAIIIFKNHGPSAGTSLEHPHSQLIATPVVPVQIRDRIQQATTFFDGTGKCMFCMTLENELRENKRVVLETDHFAAFVPYAALSPFAMWIFPKRHMASLADIDDREIADLAVNLKNTLCRLYYGLDNPDFNYVIRSIPVNEGGKEYFHWYISIIPRISQPAGFEMGSGMFINTSLPEETAQFLKNAC